MPKNPFIFKDFNDTAKGDISDYNSEEAYELGVSAGIEHTLQEIYNRMQFADIDELWKYLEERGVPKS